MKKLYKIATLFILYGGCVAVALAIAMFVYLIGGGVLKLWEIT